jgi:hypothetical protein
MKYFVINISVVLLIILISCNEEKPFKCNCNTEQLECNDSLIATYTNDTALFNFHHRVYNIEPLSIFGHEAYRLRIGHGFSQYTQIYTLSKNNKGASLEVIQYFSPKERNKKIRIDKRFQIQLTEKEWNLIKKEIDSSCYWANQVGSDLCVNCLDGGTWRLEGYDPESKNCAGQQYHIDACDYGSKSKLGKLCLKIIKFGNEEELDLF